MLNLLLGHFRVGIAIRRIDISFCYIRVPTKTPSLVQCQNSAVAETEPPRSVPIALRTAHKRARNATPDSLLTPTRLDVVRDPIRHLHIFRVLCMILSLAEIIFVLGTCLTPEIAGLLL